MAPASLLKEVRLDAERHRATGNTRHYVGGNLHEGGFTALRIVQYANDGAYYLLYIGPGGHQVTDTWHQTLEDALHQAELEFSVRSGDWSDAH